MATTQATPPPNAASPRPPGRKRRRSRTRKLISRYFGYALLVAGHAVVSRLPLSVGLALSRWVGALSGVFMRPLHRRAFENLQRVYGDELTDRELSRRVREVFQHSVATAIEWVIVRRWSNDRLRQHYGDAVERLVQMEREVKASGGGVVGFTAHFGNWEVLSLLVHRFAPGLLVPIAKRAYFEKYQTFIHDLRTHDGMEVIYNDESPRRLIRAIRKGQLLGLLPDQDLRTNSGVFVDFFGKPTYTVTFPVDLARKLNVKMICVYLVRVPGALSGRPHGYYALVSDLLDVPHTDDVKKDVLDGTQLWTSILEAKIREYPSQWCWMYPRWRSKPGDPRLPHGLRKLRREQSASSTQNSLTTPSKA